MVAESLGREWVGIELNPEYAAMAERRAKVTRPLFPQEDSQVNPYYRDTDHGERMDYLKAVRELRRSKR